MDLAALNAKAEALVRAEGKWSTSFLRRRLGVGYGTAQKLQKHPEAAGLIPNPEAPSEAQHGPQA